MAKPNKPIAASKKGKPKGPERRKQGGVLQAKPLMFLRGEAMPIALGKGFLIQAPLFYMFSRVKRTKPWGAFNINRRKPHLVRFNKFLKGKGMKISSSDVKSGSFFVVKSDGTIFKSKKEANEASEIISKWYGKYGPRRPKAAGK